MEPFFISYEDDLGKISWIPVTCIVGAELVPATDSTEAVMTLSIRFPGQEDIVNDVIHGEHAQALANALNAASFSK